MKTVLLTVILFGLVAVCQAQDTLPLLSEHRKLIGTWYNKAIVTDNNMTEEMSNAFPMVMTAPEEGKLEAKVRLMWNGQCIDYYLVIQQTEEPGKYTLFGTKMLMYIYELPVKDHYILYCENNLFGKTFHIGKLIGKNPEENLEALEEFKKFAQHRGLLLESITVPEQRGERMSCPGPSPMSTLCHP